VLGAAVLTAAAWGWSKITYRTWYALGGFIVVFLLGMMHGNHIGHVENWFLLAFAAIVAFVMLRDFVLRRRGFLR
jgi:purine-cytosine permease-like protein